MQQLHVAVVPDSFTFSCDVNSAWRIEDVTLPFTVSIIPVFRSPSGVDTLACSLVGSDGSGMGNANVTVLKTATLWPLFDDSIVIMGDGTMVSVSLGAMNGTSALLSRSCLAPSLESTAQGTNTSFCTVSAALKDPSVVLNATVALWDGQQLPRPQNVSSVEVALASMPEFSLTLLGKSWLALRSQVCFDVKNHDSYCNADF